MIFLVLISIYVMANLTRSRVGRAWIAIRDNDIAAETLGVNIVKYKLLAFFVAGAMAGMAGSFYITALFFVSPEHYEWFYSLIWVGAILIGGVGSIHGVIFGSGFVVLVFKLLEMAIIPLTEMMPWFSLKLLYIKESAFGLAIILFMLYEPNGLAYRWWQIKNYFNLWPFSY